MSVEIRQPGRRIHWSALRRAQQRFGHYLVHYRRSLGLAFLCLLGSMVTTVLAPWPLKMVIDALVPAKSGAAQAGRLARLTSSPTMLLVVVCGSVLGIAALAGLFTYGQRLLTARVTHRILAKIRRDLFAHVQRLPLSFHAGQHSGDLVMRMTGDVQMLREVLIAEKLDQVMVGGHSGTPYVVWCSVSRKRRGGVWMSS